MPSMSLSTSAADRDQVGSSQIERRLRWWLFVGVTAVFLIFQEGAVTGYDGITMYQVAKSIVEQGNVSISGEWNTLPGRNGLEYGRYGLGLSLVAAVPVVLAEPLAASLEDPEQLLEAAASAVMPLITAGLIVALYSLGRRLGARPQAALLSAIGGVVGTFFLPYSKEFYAEPLAALLVTVAIERILARRENASGLALGAAIATRAQVAFLVPFFLFAAWRHDGARGALRVGAWLVPGLLVTFGYNFLRFAHPLHFGYEDSGFTTPFLTGATGLLFNPLKSVFLFAPVVLVLPLALTTLWRRSRTAFLLITSNLAITFFLIATWFAWHGGWCWGPRLLIPGLAPAFATVGPWLSGHRYRIVVILLGLGFLVSFPALLVSTQRQQLEVPPVPPWTHFLDTQPLSSPAIIRQFELIPSTASYSFDHLYDPADDGRNYLRYLSVWQFGVTRVLGTPGLLVSLVGTILLIAVGGFALAKLAQTVREASLPSGGRT
jgi:hypothetical protein